MYMNRTISAIAICLCIYTAAAAHGQDFDACGVVARGEKCFTFEGGGGTYYIDAADFGRFELGDAIRVTGNLIEGCRTICGDEVDGCIQGAAVYSVLEFPCGTDIPSLQTDLVPSLCTSATGALTGAIAAGLWLAGRRTGTCAARRRSN